MIRGLRWGRRGIAMTILQSSHPQSHASLAVPIDRCRACGGSALVPLLDLGVTPLANALITASQLNKSEPTYPLALVFCPGCTLVQITHTIAPENLFSEYVYFSCVSETMDRHSSALAEQMVARRGLDGASLVIEIASNDGYLLRHYRRRGVPVLGIEPAANVARAAVEQHGVDTLREFFSRDLARKLRAEGKAPDVLHAHNVLGHAADLPDFVEGMAVMLRGGGVAVIEVPYVKDMIDRTEFDTIYHEHLCYYSLKALDRLFGGVGLRIVEADRLAIHGGSLRICVEDADGATKPGKSVDDLLSAEAQWGLDLADYYRGFADRVRGLRDELRDTLAGLKREGKRLAAYGASAKGSTLLNYCGIGAELLEFVVDRSVHKQGRFTPGTHLPILGPEALVERMPDCTLMLTWNFIDEIMDQQRQYVDRGGRFIVPIGGVRIV